MIAKTTFFILFAFQSLCATPLFQQFQQKGYAEICDTNHGTEAYDSLYASFDALIEYLQANPSASQKLSHAKERFIRSKDRNHYSTDFFGLFDESKREGRHQIAFYYSIHFHDYICTRYPELKKIPQIMHFFDLCRAIQEPYADIFVDVAAELNLEAIFSSPPILLKVIKYFPTYKATKPHYDGTAFSLFLDSTENQSLLVSPYKSSLVVDDFAAAHRQFPRNSNQNSIVLIPGALLMEFSIFPTPHIVTGSGNTRYATIAFAMRPNFTMEKIEWTPLPSFND
jgi:hypothetical protein